MEGCFLSSNSLTKATELNPLINPKLFTSPKKNASLHYYKPGISSSIKCCQLGSSSSKDDDIKPIITRDWRSFRARLVAEEKISSLESPSSSSCNIDPPKLSMGDKWAHLIHEPEKGCLLIATEKLDGVHIFERTVVLLLSTGPIGPTGIILNRPSLMSIKETKSSILGLFSDRPLFFGGPLEGGLFLVSGRNDDDDGVGRSGVFEEVMKGLHYGTKESMGCAAEMVKRNMIGLSDIKFFDGYCGWEKDQLNEEIGAGYWTVAACSPSVIGLESESCGGMWKEVLGLMGSKMVW